MNVINGFAECGIFLLDLEWTSKEHNQKKLRVSDPLKVILPEGDADGNGTINMEMHLEMHSCVAAARVATKLCASGKVSEVMGLQFRCTDESFACIPPLNHVTPLAV